MRHVINWQVKLGLLLAVLALMAVSLHYMIFHDARYLESFAITTVAYIFIEVFLVTLVIHGLLEYREKRAMLKKLNMVIGAFYSESGTAMLRLFSIFDLTSHKIARELGIKSGWSDKDFARVEALAGRYEPAIEYRAGDLDELKRFLVERRRFLLGLLENPNLLEHETFTNLLWAVFHLTEELAARKDLVDTPKKDHEHIIGDMRRVYSLLLKEWIAYMRHMKEDYPYLFSFAMRTNPFDSSASVEIS